MYFDLEPKNNLKDLCDFEQPFSRLMNLLEDRRARAPLITVTGPRRAGKTSLIKSALTESGHPHVILGGHAFADKPASQNLEFKSMKDKIKGGEPWDTQR